MKSILLKKFALLSLLCLIGCQANQSGQQPQAGTPRSREEALAQIGRLGGKVKEDKDFPRQPCWNVDLHKCPIKDGDVDSLIECLNALPNIGDLDLCETEITEAGLAKIMRLKTVSCVALSDNLRNSPVISQRPDTMAIRGPFSFISTKVKTSPAEKK